MNLLRPDSHYAVSKCFGESLASLYADKYNIKSMSIRIGSALPKAADKRFLSTWISFRDLVQLVSIGLKNKNKNIKIALSDPMGSALFSHVKGNKLESFGSSITEGIGNGRITKNFDKALVDEAH